MREMSQAARGINWLITDFVNNTPGVAHAVVVVVRRPAAGVSEGFPKDRADQLAAVAAGLISLTQGASRVFEGGMVTQTVVEMQRGLLLIMSISDGSCLAVLAASDCDMGLVAYDDAARGPCRSGPHPRGARGAAGVAAAVMPHDDIGDAVVRRTPWPNTVGRAGGPLSGGSPSRRRRVRLRRAARIRDALVRSLSGRTRWAARTSRA